MNEDPNKPGADNPEAWSAPPPPPPSQQPESTAAESPAGESPATSSTPAQEAEPAPAPAGEPSRKKSLPSWLPVAAAALIPAVLVGLIVFFVAGGSENGGGSCGTTLDGFVRLSLSQGEEIESSCDLPQGFPKDIPVYSGASLDGGFAIKSEDGTTFIVAYSTSAEKSDVYDFYLEAMDEDPWQIELSREADDFTGMQFSRPDSADIQGSITISHSDLDDRTAIFVFLLDSSLTSTTSGSSGSGIPTASKSLPPGFPNDIPIFKGKNETIILDTYFQRDAGQNAFLVSFLTKDADVDVINYYTQEFQKRGWSVRDGEASPGDFALTIEFDDNKPSKEVQGTIRADVYSEDASYTEVNLIVQVSASRGRGN
jgi:hypothetical protein